MTLKKKLSEEEIKNQIKRAKEAWKQASLDEPRAMSVSYNRLDKKIHLILTNGVEISIPTKLIEGVGNASDDDQADVCLSSFGASIHWEKLDVDLSILGLVKGVFGTKRWMAELGRRGGQQTSTPKAIAARENGKKGGRPRKNAPVVS